MITYSFFLKKIIYLQFLSLFNNQTKIKLKRLHVSFEFSCIEKDIGAVPPVF